MTQEYFKFVIYWKKINLIFCIFYRNLTSPLKRLLLLLLAHLWHIWFYWLNNGIEVRWIKVGFEVYSERQRNCNLFIDIWLLLSSSSLHLMLVTFGLIHRLPFQSWRNTWKLTMKDLLTQHILTEGLLPVEYRWLCTKLWCFRTEPSECWFRMFVSFSNWWSLQETESNHSQLSC